MTYSHYVERPFLPFISALTLGAISVLTIIIARDFGKLKVAQVFIAILLTGAVFLVQKELPAPWQSIASSITTMAPALFWLLCLQAFAYRPKVISIAGGLALYSFAAPAINKLMGFEAENEPTLQFFTWSLAIYIEYLVIGLGLWNVIFHWEDDLVESSRQLRRAVLIIVGLTILLVIIPMNSGLFTLDITYLIIFASILLCSYYLIEGKKSLLLSIQQSISSQNELHAGVQTTIEQPVKSLDQVRLSQLVEDGFYRTEHLTIKILAKALELPEYKTRALINQTLGYRNFNDFIHQLRIQEAAQRLSNEPHTPILNISLDVGYRALSSFNRAFKDIKNITPTEHRHLSTNPD
ncbi:MAG: AraC-like DNA-binding protein [Psychrobacter glaciei]|jgi:AraC-like DNA-binding protein